MRKLVHLLVAVFLLGAPNITSACSLDNPPVMDEDHFAKASAVFVAHIYRTEEIELPSVDGSPRRPGVEATFRLIEALKGQSPTERKVRSNVVIMCAVPLLVGFDYLIFVDANDFVLQSPNSGTRLLFDTSPNSEDKFCHHRQCVLNKLRGLAKRVQ